MSELTVRQQLEALINSLTDEQERALLDYLRNKGTGFRKRAERKNCSIATDYSIGGKTFKGTIRNIAAGGLYVRPDQPHFAGQEILVDFQIPDSPEPVWTSGKIVRNDLSGFAVQFSSNK